MDTVTIRNADLRVSDNIAARVKNKIKPYAVQQIEAGHGCNGLHVKTTTGIACYDVGGVVNVVATDRTRPLAWEPEVAA